MKRIVLLFLICGCSQDITIAELDPVVMRRPPGMVAMPDAGMDADVSVTESDAQLAEPDVILEPLASCDEGEAVFKADDWCLAWDSDSPNAMFDNCVDGKLQGYYSGLPCPFDVAVAHRSGWDGPCPGCIDDIIITNGGFSTSAAWRGKGDSRYCCDSDGVTVRFLPSAR